MAAPIGPGDFVECVDASPRAHNTYPPRLVTGRVYLVIGVGLTGGIASAPGLELKGAPYAYPCGYYRADRFRPIYRPKQEIIESLKAPPKVAPVRESEDA